MLRFSVVLFDLDGTLLDTTALIIKSFQHACALHLQKEIAPADVYPYFGRPLRHAMEKLGPACVEEMIETYREYNLANHDRMVGIFPGTVETVKRLAAAGVKMGIVTSKTQKTALRGLRMFGLDEDFQAVIGLEQTTLHKPDPAPVLEALAELHAIPEETLMVGDSPYDLQSARRAGVKTAAVRWTAVPWQELEREKPDYILGNICDLEQIVGIA